jgi:hypothetical protein
VLARRFEANGTALGAPFQVNSYTVGPQAAPAIGGMPAGGFVVSWDSSGQDGDDSGVFFQRFNPACGNGVIDPWEECDPPLVGSCSLGCMVVS